MRVCHVMTVLTCCFVDFKGGDTTNYSGLEAATSLRGDDVTVLRTSHMWSVSKSTSNYAVYCVLHSLCSFSHMRRISDD